MAGPAVILGGISAAVGAVADGLDKLFTSDAERLSYKVASDTVKVESDKVQVDQTRANTERFSAENRVNEMNAQANIEEAKHGKGWRTRLGEVTAIAVGAYFIPQYVMASFIWARQCLRTDTIVPYPVSGEDLLWLVGLMLGYGGIKAYEKKAGLRR